MSVGSHVSITLSCKLCSWGVWDGGGGGGDGWFKSPTYFAIYHHLAKYTYRYYFAIKFRLNGSWFVIHDEILEFHNWTLCYHEHFQDKIKRWKSLELKMDLWHLTDMKVILTLQILNFAESCAPFSCIDSFAFDEIKWLCAFFKHTTQKSITKSHELVLPTSVSCSWYYLHTSIDSIWY